MSVTVKRSAPVKQPPANSILVTDDLGDKLKFEAAAFRFKDVLHASLDIQFGASQFVRLTRADARSLGAALLEWADAVEA